MSSNLKDKMKEQGITMREMSEITGLSTALICYIAQGYAMFPTYGQLDIACIRLGCEPKDLYSYGELRRMYPKEVPVKKRAKENPRIRINKITYEIIRQNYDEDVGRYVNECVHRQLRHEYMREEGHDI